MHLFKDETWLNAYDIYLNKEIDLIKNKYW